MGCCWLVVVGNSWWLAVGSGGRLAVGGGWHLVVFGWSFKGVLNKKNRFLKNPLAPAWPYIHTYISAYSQTQNHLPCRLMELPGISHRQVVPTLLNPAGLRAA